MTRLLTTLWLLLMTCSAAAAEQRYALIVGVNEGDAGEEELRFAERDAVAMADVFRRVGGVAAEDLVLMRGTDAADVFRALEAMRRRIGSRRKDGQGALLFVYYSGHAAAGSAHLRGTRLDFEDLQRRVRATGADASVIIMDACRSGGLTRVKGGVTAEPFTIKVSDDLQSSGLAIISSSAAGEDAQESDRLRGGIFTHHVINGLLGAGDANRDRRVTLSEAYDYAFTETVRTTSRTRFVQHPTYSFRIKGRKELVLTTLSQSRALGAMQLPAAGNYVVMERGAGGQVVAEVAAASQAQLLVPPGDYLVRRREPSAVYEQSIRVPRGGSVTVAKMIRQPYGRTVRKGLATERRVVVGVTAFGEVGGPTFRGLSVSGFGGAGVRLDFEPVSLETRFRYGRASSSNRTVALTQDMFGVDVGLFKVFDLPKAPVGFGIGLRLGGDWIRQSFATVGTAPERQQWVWRAAPVVRFEAALHAVVSLTIDGGADILMGDFLDPDTGEAAFDARVVPFGSLGFVFYIP